MKPVRKGQIVKFHSPMEDEDPEQLYVILEVKGDGDDARLDIQALDTGMMFPPVSTVMVEDLVVVA